MAKKRTVRKQGSPKAKPEQFSIPAELVEHILLGPADDRRVLQDSPLLGDVWAAYALDPGVVQDVLITPHKNTTAAAVAAKIREQPTDKGEEDQDRLFAGHRGRQAVLRRGVANHRAVDAMVVAEKTSRQNCKNRQGQAEETASTRP